MKTVIGIDYGTQSARAVLVNTEDGKVLCSHSVNYPHGVMEGDLASAADYEQALEELLRAVTPKKWRETVSGICVDATSLTLVPVSDDGRVLCQLPRLENELHAQIKLWKRHTAQQQADEALALAQKWNLPILKRTGGSISSEWMLPKVMEIRDEAPEVYARMDLALDLCEFLTFRLTGQISRGVPSHSFKGMWARDLGFPEGAWMDALRPGFAAEYRHLMRGEVLRPGDCAGQLKPEWCEKLGLSQPVQVACGVLDGHTAPLALGALKAGDAALVIGTSNVLALQLNGLMELRDVCGVAEDGFACGLTAVDSGQSCTGDMLQWYVDHCLPAEVVEEAQKRRISPHELLCGRIVRPWENHVTALDWWNGSRNAPCNLKLSGGILGLRLDTRPEEIYLALLQSIVCGTREIIEACEQQGASVRRILAAGGIAHKNPLLMQEYANLLNRPVWVGSIEQGPAMGAALLAAVACGVYSSVDEAHEHMGIKDFTAYQPEHEHRAAYEALWQRNHRLRQAVSALEN